MKILQNIQLKTKYFNKIKIKIIIFLVNKKNWVKKVQLNSWLQTDEFIS